MEEKSEASRDAIKLKTVGNLAKHMDLMCEEYEVPSTIEEMVSNIRWISDRYKYRNKIFYIIRSPVNSK